VSGANLSFLPTDSQTEKNNNFQQKTDSQ
jgi:hypothetical protein